MTRMNIKWVAQVLAFETWATHSKAGGCSLFFDRAQRSGEISGQRSFLGNVLERQKRTGCLFAFRIKVQQGHRTAADIEIPCRYLELSLFDQP